MLTYFKEKKSFGMFGFLIKFLSIGLILFGFSGGTSSVYAESNNDTATTYEVSQDFIKYEAPDINLSLATAEQIKQLEEIGWNLDADVPFLLIEKETGEQAAETLSVKAETINLSELLDDDQDYNLADDPSKSVISPFVISYGVFSAPPHGSKVYKNGDAVHCNRFNGPNSDGRHLGKLHPQTYINYYKSDCYYGVNSGICTYTNDKCNTSLYHHRGWCSSKQGWSVNYHKR